DKPWSWGDRVMPIVWAMLFAGLVILLLIWQLARMVTAFRQIEQKVIVERHFIREPLPTQLGAPTEQTPRAIDPTSVTENTTRQFANLYESPKVEEKTGAVVT